VAYHGLWYTVKNIICAENPIHRERE